MTYRELQAKIAKMLESDLDKQILFICCSVPSVNNRKNVFLKLKTKELDKDKEYYLDHYNKVEEIPSLLIYDCEAK